MLPPPPGGGRPRTTDLREVLNAILYVLRTGCAWDLLPHDFPPPGTVYGYFSQWRRDGTIARVHDTLQPEGYARPVRARPRALGGQPGSQSAKSTEIGGIKGFDAGKKVKGRKRHILVDTSDEPISPIFTKSGGRGPAGSLTISMTLTAEVV